MCKILNIVVIYISVTALVFGHATPAYAGLIGTDQILLEDAINQDREILYEILDRNEAQNFLENNGVSKKQAQERIAALTDEEVKELKQNFEDLPAGGVGSAAAILILVLLAIVLVLGR
ncbi:MAG: PA2779 family protein [Pseudomonadota bacterium]